MKPLPVLIALSLAANAALLAVLSLRATGSGSGSSSPSDSSRHASASGSFAGRNAASAVDPKLWADLSSSEYSAQIARLRAAGFPEIVVRAIITAEIQTSFAARRKALSPPSAHQPYWQNPPPTDRKLAADLRALALEQNKLLSSLFDGPDLYANVLGSLSERRQNAGLPAAKIDQIARVKRDYNEMRADIMAGGTLLPEDRAKMVLLDKEQRADIATLLSPRELEDYDLRTSSTAMQMRSSLGSFNPSEAEFRTIYKLQTELNERFPATGLSAATAVDMMRQRGEAQTQINAQIQAALGPERGADYARSTDYNYQAIDRVAQRLDLPKTAAIEAWTVQKDIQARARALQLDQDLTPETRSAQLAALSAEATTKFTTALGPRGFEVYQQNGGAWLQTLQPRPAGARGGGGMTIITNGLPAEISITRPGG